MHDDESQIPDLLFPWTQSPSVNASSSQTSSLIIMQLPGLNSKAQRLLVCRYEKNMEWQEVAEDLGLPVERVRRMYYGIVHEFVHSNHLTQHAEPLNEGGPHPSASTAGVGRTERAIRTLSFLIPRQIREPVVGDLLEDLRQLRLAGAKRWWILVTAVSQVLNALLQHRKIWLLVAATWLAVTIRAWLVP